MPNLIGQVLLDKFRVDAFIASGGMGSVYRVWDLKRNVFLAMKVLHSDLADDPHILNRFQREARALKKLAHPNIVPFYGMYQADDLIFLLEHFVDGPNLKDVLREHKGELELSEALAYLKPVCAATGYAHANGVVHCDIKPGNIMLDQNGKIFLTDFGIARHAESSNTTFASAGTPAYMAPEQILGNSLSAASDVYALGIILFEMLTGRRPFRGDEAATTTGGANSPDRIRYGHLHLLPPHVNDINLKISGQVDVVIQKALEKLPENRYQDAGEFFNALFDAAGIPDAQIPAVHNIFRNSTTPASFENGRQLISSSRPSTPVYFWVIGSIVISLGLIGFAVTRSKPSAAPPVLVQSVPTATQKNATATHGYDQTSSPTSQVTPSASPTPDDPAPTETRQPPTVTPVTGKLYTPLTGCAPSYLRKGDMAYVVKNQDRLFVRSNPDTHPTDNVINYIYAGDVVTITAGPACSYGWLMWEVAPSSGRSGWVVENDGKDFFLALENNQTNLSCPGVLPTKLKKGGKAQVSRNGIANTIRKSAGTSGKKSGTIKPGAIVEILDGPTCLDGYTWWEVRPSSGDTGWTAEGDGKSYFLNPYP